MSERRPLPPIGAADIERLVAYLPRLRALLAADPQFARLQGGDRLPGGAIAGFWVEYPDLVSDFFSLAGDEPWSDYNYDPVSTGDMIREHGRIARASLDEVRTMLTWCVRGERFCDGHWGAVLGDGAVFRLLERLERLLPALGAE